MEGKHCEVIGYAIPETECAEIKIEKFHECDDCASQVGREVKNIMGEGKRKYTMSEAALKARKNTAIKAGAKRSEKIRHKSALKERTYPAAKQGVASKKKIKATPTRERTITIDFFEHPELFEQLIKLAEVEMRPLDNLIIYFLKRGDFSGIHAVIN